MHPQVVLGTSHLLQFPGSQQLEKGVRVPRVRPQPFSNVHFARVSGANFMKKLAVEQEAPEGTAYAMKLRR